MKIDVNQKELNILLECMECFAIGGSVMDSELNDFNTLLDNLNEHVDVLTWAKFAKNSLYGIFELECCNIQINLKNDFIFFEFYNQGSDLVLVCEISTNLNRKDMKTALELQVKEVFEVFGN